LVLRRAQRREYVFVSDDGRGLVQITGRAPKAGGAACATEGRRGGNLRVPADMLRRGAGVDDVADGTCRSGRGHNRVEVRARPTREAGRIPPEAYVPRPRTHPAPCP